MMDPDAVNAVAQAILARRIGEHELERAALDARAQLAEQRCRELEAELATRPAEAKGRRAR